MINKKNKKKDYSMLWSVLCDGIKGFIKSETCSIKGKLNLLFGIILSLFFFAYVTQSFLKWIITTILNFIKPGSVSTTSWIVAVIFLTIIAIYFYLCVKFTNSVDDLKNKISSIDSKEDNARE